MAVCTLARAHEAALAASPTAATPATARPGSAAAIARPRPRTAGPTGGAERLGERLGPAPSVPTETAARGTAPGAAPLLGMALGTALGKALGPPSSEAAAALVALDELVAGEFMLQLTNTATHATASAGRLCVQAGALDASRCVAEGSGLERAVPGEPAEFTVTPRDANGYVRRMARGAPFRVCVLNGAARIESTVEARLDGSYVIKSALPQPTPRPPLLCHRPPLFCLPLPSRSPFPPPSPALPQLPSHRRTATLVPRYVPFTRKAEGSFLLSVTFAAKPIRGSPFRVTVAEAGNALTTTLGRRSPSAADLFAFASSAHAPVMAPPAAVPPPPPAASLHAAPPAATPSATPTAAAPALVPGVRVAGAARASRPWTAPVAHTAAERAARSLRRKGAAAGQRDKGARSSELSVVRHDGAPDSHGTRVTANPADLFSRLQQMRAPQHRHMQPPPLPLPPPHANGYCQATPAATGHLDRELAKYHGDARNQAHPRGSSAGGRRTGDLPANLPAAWAQHPLAAGATATTGVGRRRVSSTSVLVGGGTSTKASAASSSNETKPPPARMAFTEPS